MAEPRGRYGLPPELGVAALVVAASLPLGRLFRTGRIGTVSFAAAVASATVAWGLRRMRTPAPLSALISGTAFLWFASVAFFRSTMLGPLPSGRTLSSIWHAISEGVQRSQQDAAPVSASIPFLCLAAFAVWATAWLADDAAAKLRHPMLAIGVTVPLFVLPGTIVTGNARWLEAGLYLAAALWVLFQDERYRLSRWGRLVGAGTPGWRPGLAARIGLVAIALALVIAPVLPGYGSPPGLAGINAGSNERVTVNPLVSILPQLADKTLVDLFTVRSRVPAYWRLTALDLFNGTAWTAATQQPELRLAGRSIEPSSPAPDAARVEQQFRIDRLGGPWAPAAFEPVRIDRLRGAGADAETRTIIVPGDLRPGTQFTVMSRIPQLSYPALDLAGEAADPSLRPYLGLPLNAEISALAVVARGILEGARALDAGPFRRAVALQNHLRTFRYDEDIGLHHSISDIQDFLELRAGYCEQFASTMAVFARLVGLPSRVAIGFAVGAQGDRPDEFRVTSRHAHAWVEIYISGFGWVAFEPTPRTDLLLAAPPYTTPASPSQPNPTSAPSPTPTTTASPTSNPPERRLADPQDPSAGGGASRALTTTGISLGGLLLLAVAGVPGAALVRRSLRRRRARTALERVSARYLDFLDRCAAAGMARRSGETPLEHARRLAGLSTEASALARDLAVLATRAVYAPPGLVDEATVAEVSRTAARAVVTALPRRDRALARIGWGWWRTDVASRAGRRGVLAAAARA